MNSLIALITSSTPRRRHQIHSAHMYDWRMWRAEFPARKLGSWYPIKKNKCWEVRGWFLSIDLFQALATEETEIESDWPLLICQEKVVFLYVNTSISKLLIVSSEPRGRARGRPWDNGHLLTTLWLTQYVRLWLLRRFPLIHSFQVNKHPQ